MALSPLPRERLLSRYMCLQNVILGRDEYTQNKVPSVALLGAEVHVKICARYRE